MSNQDDDLIARLEKWRDTAGHNFALRSDLDDAIILLAAQKANEQHTADCDITAATCSCGASDWAFTEGR